VQVWIVVPVFILLISCYFVVAPIIEEPSMEVQYYIKRLFYFYFRWCKKFFFMTSFFSFFLNVLLKPWLFKSLCLEHELRSILKLEKNQGEFRQKNFNLYSNSVTAHKYTVFML
jgi:hypothetical protein